MILFLLYFAFTEKNNNLAGFWFFWKQEMKDKWVIWGDQSTKKDGFLFIWESIARNQGLMSE